MPEQGKGLPASLDPRSCLICAAVFSIAAACLNSIPAALAALALSICVLPVTWKKEVHLARRLLAVNSFILFLWLVTPFTTPGEIIWHWGFLRLSREGLELTLLVTIKANALALIFLSLIAPLPPSALGAAMRKLHCPDKLTWIFLLMGRNIHLLESEWHRLRDSARLRCFKARNNLHSYKTFGSLIGLFLIRAVERARILHEAMLLRGYNGTLPFCQELRFRARDYIFFLCCIASVSLLLLIESGLLHVSL